MSSTTQHDTAQLLLNGTDIDPSRLVSIVTTALHGYDGELFIESSSSTGLTFVNGHIDSNGTGHSADGGFGLRLLSGEQSAYIYSDDLTNASVLRAVDKIAEAKRGYRSGIIALPSTTAPHATSLYTPDNILLSMPDQDEQIRFFEAIEQRLRAADSRITKVQSSLSAGMQYVHIIRADGTVASDIRPMATFRISAVGQQGERREMAGAALSKQADSRTVFNQAVADGLIAEVLRDLNDSFEAVDAPSGVMPVVVGNGWGGVLLHEAVGHGLEGDFNRKGTSRFSGQIGNKVAASEVTIIDDGTIPYQRGSLNIDDEGTSGAHNVLIENGILKGYMQDKQNAALMKMPPTGNGRREDFRNMPIPRMTNTYMVAGQHTPEEIIGSIQNGIYATNFSGGQVEIANGDFVFDASQAFRIRNGKVAEPVRGVAIKGNGPVAMKNTIMVGSDFQLANTGSCGKAGQHASVSLGQPTIRIDGLVVGGMG